MENLGIRARNTFHEIIDWLILMACQLIRGHFVLRDSEIAYIYICIFFCCFLEFFSHGYDIKYFYQIQIIWNQIHLTYTWDTNRYYHSRSERTWEKWQWRGDSILPISTELEPHYQMQFCIIPMTPLFGGVTSLMSLQRIQNIPRPTCRAFPGS